MPELFGLTKRDVAMWYEFDSKLGTVEETSFQEVGNKFGIVNWDRARRIIHRTRKEVRALVKDRIGIEIDDDKITFADKRYAPKKPTPKRVSTNKGVTTENSWGQKVEAILERMPAKRKQRTVAALSDMYRRLLEFDVGSMSQSEIARRLNSTPANVNRQLMRVAKKLTPIVPLSKELNYYLIRCLKIKGRKQ